MRAGQPRVLGPYREPDGWRVVVVQQGTRSATKTQSEAEAHALKRELEAEISGRQQTTVAGALESYREHLQTKGNRESSIGATIGRLTVMFAAVEDLRELTPARGRKLYDQLRTRRSASTGRRPIPSDIRDTGNIESDADTICMIYRDEVYNSDTEDKGIAELIIRKARNGATGTVRARWYAETTTFTDE